MMKYVLSSLVAIGSLALLGCGKGGPAEATATVTGKVTLAGGKPLPGGRITFRLTTAAHRFSTAEIKADGTYEAKNVPQGECKVFIDNTYLKQAASKAGGYQMPGTEAPPPGVKYVAIKPKYTSEATTDLSTTVKTDPDTYSVELK